MADDMGLGKTLQVLAFLASKKPKTLIVCPASLVYNWEDEIRKFVPSMSSVVITGSQSVREELILGLKNAEVGITSYDLLKRDLEAYENRHFDCMIIDEAQYIKNAGTQTARAVKAIDAHWRFALTGTPIENRLSDLWSIFDFIMPGYLFGYKQFKKDFEEPAVIRNDEAVIARIQDMTAPFILRRKKTDVLKELPEKLEEVIYTRMSEKQEQLYQALALDLLENAVAGGHKVLVFSQFTQLLELLIEKYQGIGDYLYLSGKNSKEQRRQMVEAFQNGHIPVFFISLKAGGTGLNLTAADMVIHYDPWWNVAAQNQATDRTHRIGQKNVVNVIRLVTKNTIEEKMLHIQEKKEQLSDSILNGEQAADAVISREQLLELLKN